MNEWKYFFLFKKVLILIGGSIYWFQRERKEEKDRQTDSDVRETSVGYIPD